jgi:hypothetical protein
MVFAPNKIEASAAERRQQFIAGRIVFTEGSHSEPGHFVIEGVRRAVGRLVHQYEIGAYEFRSPLPLG